MRLPCRDRSEAGQVLVDKMQEHSVVGSLFMDCPSSSRIAKITAVPSVSACLRWSSPAKVLAHHCGCNNKSVYCRLGDVYAQHHGVPRQRSIGPDRTN
jgi:hypothetical protein